MFADAARFTLPPLLSMGGDKVLTNEGRCKIIKMDSVLPIV